MLINKEGKQIANNSQPVKTFATASEYTAWYDSLPNPTEDIKKFIVVKQYELSENSYIEVNTVLALTALSANQKKENCLYGVKENNKLYRYDSASDSFIIMSVTNDKYLHQICYMFADELGTNYGFCNFNLVTDTSDQFDYWALLEYFEANRDENIILNGFYSGRPLCYYRWDSGVGEGIYGVTDDGIDIVTYLSTLQPLGFSDKVTKLN